MTRESLTEQVDQRSAGVHLSTKNHCHSTYASITQYSSIYCVYRDCHAWSSIIAIHKEISVFTFSFNLNLSFKDIKVENM